MESRGLPGNSTCILEAEPGTLDIKRHSSSVRYIIDVTFFLVFQSSCCGRESLNCALDFRYVGLCLSVF